MHERGLLITFLALFMTVTPDSAAAVTLFGDFKGNGGDVVTCADGSVTVLDVYESPLTAPPRSADLESVYLNRLEAAGQIHLAAKLRARASSFLDESVMVTSGLGDVVDEGHHVPLPAGCQLEQIANQNPSLLPNGKRYIINQRLWEKLDPFNQTALMFHELLYSFSKNSSSEEIRAIHRSLLANEFSNRSPFEIFDSLRKAGLPIFTRMGFPIVIDASAMWMKSGDQFRLSRGTAAANESFVVCGQAALLEQYPIRFSQKAETPVAFWIKGKVTCPLPDGRSFQIETDFWGMQQGIQLHDDGSLFRAPLSTDERQSFLPGIRSARSKRLTFHPNGTIAQVTTNEVDFKFGNLYRFQAERHEFDFLIENETLAFQAPYASTISIQNQNTDVNEGDWLRFNSANDGLELTATQNLYLLDVKGQRKTVSVGQKFIVNRAGLLLE